MGAELAKQRLVELRAQETQRKRDNLRSKQLSERLEVEEAHLLEFNQFNQSWDSRQQYFEHAQELEAKMAEKHQHELEEFREKNEASISLTSKPSTELLNHQKIQGVLAKTKEYAEAHKVQQKCSQLEKDELEKWLKIRAHKLAAGETRFLTKQNIELQALKKKIQSGADEQRKQRALELEKLLQRYQNVKKELEGYQQVERCKLDGKVKNLSRTARADLNCSLSNSKTSGGRPYSSPG